MSQLAFKWMVAVKGTSGTSNVSEVNHQHHQRLMFRLQKQYRCLLLALSSQLPLHVQRDPFPQPCRLTALLRFHLLEMHPEADMGPVPVMLPIKQPPPGRSYPSTVGAGVLSTAEQFEMQATFAYTAALAKQVPVPKGLYAYNLARAKALLPPRWEALGLDQGQLYFSDTVRGCTSFFFPDRPAGAEPSVIAKTRGAGHIQLK